MNIFLVFAFLFFSGSMCGWWLEVFFRRFFSKNNPSRKWINPGFLNGPYLPIYGFGLCALYAMTMLERLIYTDNAVLQKLILFALMAAAMTAIEYIAGIIFINGMKIKLWDYSDEWGNVNGIICPKFSLFWAILSALYYFLVHPYVLDGIRWLSENLAFSFVIGLFFGVFVVDVGYSLNLTVKIRRFAAENEVVIRYERLKEEIHTHTLRGQSRLMGYLLQFRSEKTLRESLETHIQRLKKR